ncbi:hypothetical protein PCIT_b0593 [Pseudoalteromonas citrea]|uniref:Uncharacterized protein n=1 Tax=Pseudoalteromonas citrea TaxID=43655 RepID=A0AAD4AEU8_9GAMM|nr:hypothetical protein PCIT_b0593 [Pseudoalteromonas citrea]
MTCGPVGQSKQGSLKNISNHGSTSIIESTLESDSRTHV